MKLEKTDKIDCDGFVVYQFVYDSPLDEATWQLHKYEHVKKVRRSACISVSEKEMHLTDKMIEYWKKRIADLTSFNIPGWDIT